MIEPLTTAEAAIALFKQRDVLAKELAEIDARLNKLRSQYMAETNIYGIHPVRFRAAVEAGRKAA